MGATTEEAGLLGAGMGPTQLRSGSLNFIETLGQSIANVAPTLTPTLNITVVAGLAGLGSWIAYLIATIGMMFVAGNIGALARRHPVAGSYFIYIGRTLGPMAGMVTGWSMIAAYLFTAVAVVLGGQIFMTNFLAVLGLPAYAPPAWLFDLLFVGLLAFCALRDIRVSSRLGLILEGVSLLIIILITAYAIAREGVVLDAAQLDVTRLPVGGVMSSLAFAVFSFVGFESAATLAREARQPTRSIPRAIFLCAAIAGMLFIVITYAMVACVGDKADVIGGSSSPFTEITTRAGIGWAAAIVYFSASISVFACALASVNAGARLIYSMGRYRFLHSSLGRVHGRHQTPHVAVGLCCGLTLLICLALMRPAPVDAFGYAGTFATFGFLVVYLLICVVAPLDLKRGGALKAHHVAIGAIGVALMAFVIFGSIYPVPPMPYNLLPYLFAAYLVAGGLWYALMARRLPGAMARLQNDMEV